MSSESGWLQELKAGDGVIIVRDRKKSIAMVDRVTATQIVVGEQRFNRQTGEGLGRKDRSYSLWLKPMSGKDAAEIEHLDLARRLGWMEVGDWHEVPLEKLRAVAAILDEPAVRP
jgi:hypothetical protein